jgi:hypothetical protein
MLTCTSACGGHGALAALGSAVGAAPQLWHALHLPMRNMSWGVCAHLHPISVSVPSRAAASALAGRASVRVRAWCRRHSQVAGGCRRHPPHARRKPPGAPTTRAWLSLPRYWRHQALAPKTAIATARNPASGPKWQPSWAVALRHVAMTRACRAGSSSIHVHACSVWGGCGPVLIHTPIPTNR